MPGPRFTYLRDPLFLVGCAAYALNRWWWKALFPGGLLHSHFNDFWLLPCALPVVLWVHRICGLRTHDQPPGLGEIFVHWACWSAICEWVGPKFVTHATGDAWDVVAYGLGGLLGALWWQRERWLRSAHQMWTRSDSGRHIG